jgi:tetratricopeptide (TPR) repeat protein
MTEDSKNGKVITFYSYKGGVGRTMSLVNIACLLAKKSKKVLLIDWDLEAPGLHDFFNANLKLEDLGLIDFIHESVDMKISNPENNEKEIENFIATNIDRFICTNVLPFKGNLDMIKAGKFDIEYSEKLNAINWHEFYVKSPYFFKIFASVLESKYDFIFIDSRTGLSDTGGICTMLMPQILVVVFALNNQNIKGVLDIAKQSIYYRFQSNDIRTLNVLPLPSRIDDNQNASDLQEWITEYTLKFEKLFKETYLLDECDLTNYFNKAKIPYKSEHAYGEKIPVLVESSSNDLFITYHYSMFSNFILENKSCWEFLSNEQILDNQKKANEVFKDALKSISNNKFDEASNNIERALLMAQNDVNLFLRWAENLVSIAWNETGEKRDYLYKQTFEIYYLITDIEPNNYETYYNWGIDLGNLAKTREIEEAEQLYKLAFEKYEKAINIKSNLNDAYLNWGTDLINLAQIKNSYDAEQLYNQAFEKFEKAIEIYPEDDDAFFNWGTGLGNLAQTKNGDELEKLYNLAFEKYKKAIDINPNNFRPFYNWGSTLIGLAKTKSGDEKNRMLSFAIEKINTAIKLGSGVYSLSCIYALKGEKDKAMEYLSKCLDNYEIDVDDINKDSDWDELRSDPDFINLLDKYSMKSRVEN